MCRWSHWWCETETETTTNINKGDWGLSRPWIVTNKKNQKEWKTGSCPFTVYIEEEEVGWSDWHKSALAVYSTFHTNWSLIWRHDWSAKKCKLPLTIWCTIHTTHNVVCSGSQSFGKQSGRYHLQNCVQKMKLYITVLILLLLFSLT